ncbi:PLDc N-terminal domain-containing protein [Microbacterium sp. NPDC019599]|uniref:PLDc N-terminal domain-containing protein n=1 Tax=Microbacterium sp. NPDC019599 TaxID=3154690 RepID=UPI0033C54AF6
MPRVLLILALVATAFWVFTIVDCAVQPATRHRGVSKPIWVLIVVLLPVLGGIMWLVVGRTRASAVQARRAPDDDPEFLGRIGSLSDQDERIRRLEEELAQLDAEDDDPRWTDPGGPAPKGKPAPPETATGSGTPPEPTGRGGTPDADDDNRGQRGVAG